MSKCIHLPWTQLILLFKRVVVVTMSRRTVQDRSLSDLPSPLTRILQFFFELCVSFEYLLFFLDLLHHLKVKSLLVSSFFLLALFFMSSGQKS